MKMKKKKQQRNHKKEKQTNQRMHLCWGQFSVHSTNWEDGLKTICVHMYFFCLSIDFGILIYFFDFCKTKKLLEKKR